MKTQLTILAAAVSLAMSAATFAAPPNPSQTPAITSTTNLTSVPWGVDNGDFSQDDNKWTSNAPGQNNFTWAGSALMPKPVSPEPIGEVDSLIDQTNTGTAANIAAVAQDGAIGGQYSYVRQDGDNLRADVDQQGSFNYSRINQELTSGGIVNVQQTGDRGASEVEQYGGTDNGANVTQSGSDNNSFIRQGGIGGGANSNDAHVVQTGMTNNSYVGQTHGSDNWAYVTQNGNDGISYIIQQGDLNRAELYQLNGSGNDSYIMQDNLNSSAATNYAYVEQDGSTNVSTVTQVSNSIGNAVVYQSGTSNQASTLQY